MGTNQEDLLERIRARQSLLERIESRQAAQAAADTVDTDEPPAPPPPTPVARRRVSELPEGRRFPVGEDPHMSPELQDVDRRIAAGEDGGEDPGLFRRALRGAREAFDTFRGRGGDERTDEERAASVRALTERGREGLEEIGVPAPRLAPGVTGPELQRPIDMPRDVTARPPRAAVPREEPVRGPQTPEDLLAQPDVIQPPPRPREAAIRSRPGGFPDDVQSAGELMSLVEEDLERERRERLDRPRRVRQRGEPQPVIGPETPITAAERRGNAYLRRQGESQEEHAERIRRAFPPGFMTTARTAKGISQSPLVGRFLVRPALELYNDYVRDGRMSGPEFLETIEATGGERAAEIISELGTYGVEIYGVGRTLGALGRTAERVGSAAQPGRFSRALERGGRGLGEFEPTRRTTRLRAGVTGSIEGLPSDISAAHEHDDPRAVPLGILIGGPASALFRGGLDPELLGRMAARAEAAGVRDTRIVRELDELKGSQRERALESFAEEQDVLAGRTGASREAPAPAEAPAEAAAPERPSMRRRMAERVGDIIDPTMRAEREARFVDELTGFANQDAWLRAKPRIDASPDLEVVTFDVRGLKAINDKLGHEAGDDFLRQVAEEIRTRVPQERNAFATAYRSGIGDEFTIAVPTGQGEEIGRAVQEVVGETPIEGTRFTAGIRYGVGPTFAEADAAQLAARELEVGPRPRESTVPRETPGAPAAEAPRPPRPEASPDPEVAPGAPRAPEAPSRPSEGLEAQEAPEAAAREEIIGRIEERQAARAEAPVEPAPREAGGMAAREIELEQTARPEERIPWSRRQVMADPEQTGKRQRTLFPGSDAKVETEYVVLEASEVRASHTADYTQRTSAEFPPEIQGRAYHGPRGRQAREFTEQMVSKFDPDRAFDPTVSAADGPPVVTRSGINVAGNGRTIALQRLYRTDPERAEQLVKEELARRAGDYGLDPEAIRAMDEPVLVRQIVDDSIDQLDVDQLRQLNQSSDVATGKAKDVVSEAASRADQLRAADSALRHFAETIPEDATIRSYLETADGGEFLRRLVSDGVIARSERARFIDANTGAATPEGKQLIERMFYAAAIGDPDVIARAPEGILRKIDTSLPAIIRTDRVGEGFEIGATVRDALDLLARARAEGVKLDDLIDQVDFTRPPPPARVQKMARFLETAPKNTRGEVEGIKDAFRAYADEAEAFARQTESDDLFGFEPRGPEDAGERFAALIDWRRRRIHRGEPYQELTRAERAAYVERLEARSVDVFERHFTRDRIMAAESVESFLRDVSVDPAVRSARRRPQPGQGDTWEQYGGETPTPERAEQRQRWKKTLEDNAGWADPADKPFEGPVARERKAVIITGPPAAGKSTVADPIIQSLRARVFDSDEAKKLIPEFEGGRNAGGVHEESSWVSKDLMTPAIRRGENLVWPTIGRDLEQLQKRIDTLIEQGYEVHLVLNEIPPLEAAKRAYARFVKTDRYVDFNYILRDVADRPIEVYQAMRDYPGLTSARRYSNDVPIGEAPVIQDARGPAIAEIRPTRSRGGPTLRPRSERAGRPSRSLEETAHPLVPPRDLDLFGDPVARGVGQGELGLQEGGPVGMSRAVEDARAVVSQLEGKVQRGDATDSQIRRYQDARSLVRSAEGRGLDAGELAARREGAPAPAPDDTGDLFALAPTAQAGERLPSAGAFFDSPTAKRAELVSPQEINTALAAAIDEVMPGMGLKFASGGIRPQIKKLGGLGQFDERGQIIRQTDFGDVEVFGHEAGHAMHKLFFANTPEGRIRNEDLASLPGIVRGELEDLAVGISTGDLAEGWAEAWRRYLTNYDTLRKEAPNTLRFLEDRLDEFPAIRNAWELARDDYGRFRESDSVSRIWSRMSIGDRDVKALSIEDRWSRARTSILDHLEPVRRIVQKIDENIGLEGIEEEADTLARLVRGSVGLANHFLEHGTVDFKTLRTTGKGLKEILDPVQGALDDFRVYMVARRAQELHGRDILTGIRNEDVESALARLTEQHGDTFTEAFEQLQGWNDSLLSYLRDSGVISRDSYRAIKDLNQSYVPFYRVIEGERVGRSLGESFGHLFSPIKGIKGSGRDIIDPIESMVKNAYIYTHTAQRQQVSRALAALADKPGVGAVLEELGHKVTRQQFRFGEIEGRLEEIVPGLDEVLEDLRAKAKTDYEQATAGLSADEIAERGIELYEPAEELLAIFRPGDHMGRPNTISVLEDGKRVFYEVDEELFAALEGLNNEQLGTFWRWMGVPSQTLRAGATLAPEFLIRNPIRDQVMAFVQSEYGYVPFVDMARGAFEIVNKGEAYRDWLKAGGYRAALTSLDRKSMQNAVRGMVDAGGVENVVKHPLDALQALSALMEDATRVGEFMNARNVLGTSKAGLQRAAAASREISVDFARHGAKTAQLRAISAFWNARLQGYDRLARAAKKNPARFAAKAFGMITLPSLLEYYAHMDDPEYWEQPQWKRDLFWTIRVGDDFLAIPKPFELGLIFGTLPVRVIDSAVGGPGGGYEMREFLETSLMKGEVSGFLPQPTAFMPLIENAVNYSFFLRRPIVPASEQDIRARFQAGPYTSEFAERAGGGVSDVARMLGRWAPGQDGLSPRKIDNLLYSWTGGLGRIATQATDPFLEGRLPFTPGDVPPVGTRLSEVPGIRGVMDPPAGMSSESVQRFYTLYEEARKAESTLRDREQSGDDRNYEWELNDPEATRLRDMLPELRAAAAEMAMRRSEVELIRRDPDMTPDAKRREIEAIGLEARQIAQDVLGRDFTRGAQGGGG